MILKVAANFRPQKKKKVRMNFKAFDDVVTIVTNTSINTPNLEKTGKPGRVLF